ncbi:MAG: division/cell wall cluster transcriptional repressor MraZ [Ruminococcaceae bacterium]|nr:division/cell wall cluster transcriptional repressor MraZ [Oscillospiraceae bacterium]
MVEIIPFYGKIHRTYIFVERRMLMVVFSGTYQHTVDSKNRLFIPAKFRELLGDNFMVMQNVEGCLDIITAQARDMIVEKLSLLPRTQTAKIKRFLFSGAGDCSPDSQGRVVLPKQLIEFAHLEKNVLIIGAGDHIEIWNEENFANNISTMSNESLADEMSALQW